MYDYSSYYTTTYKLNILQLRVIVIVIVIAAPNTAPLPLYLYKLQTTNTNYKHHQCDGTGEQATKVAWWDRQDEVCSKTQV